MSTPITLTGAYTCTHHNDQQRTECPVCLVAALTTERDQLRADNSTLRAAQKACEACDEPTAFEVRQLRAALALGQQNCDDAYDDLRAERAAAIARAERAEAQLATERARLDSGQILLTVAGERVWHCGVDLRAAIDAAMQEAAK